MSKFNTKLTPLVLFKEFAIWNRDHKQLRFGQYIVNNYIKPEAIAPEIFYEENPRVAFDSIYRELTE